MPVKHKMNDPAEDSLMSIRALLRELIDTQRYLCVGIDDLKRVMLEAKPGIDKPVPSITAKVAKKKGASRAKKK